MWFINVTWSIPTLLLVIAITLALGKGFWQVFIAVGLTMWVEVARVVRGEVLKIKELQYITAAKTLGFNDFCTYMKLCNLQLYGTTMRCHGIFEWLLLQSVTSDPNNKS